MVKKYVKTFDKTERLYRDTKTGRYYVKSPSTGNQYYYAGYGKRLKASGYLTEKDLKPKKRSMSKKRRTRRC